MRPELASFIDRSLEKGLSRTQIDKALKGAGWDDAERKEALAAYADVDFPVPVPRRRPYLSAREAFMYLVMFMTLYISAFNVGALIFQFINRWLPDALNPYSYSVDTIRFSVASLIVAFPIFLWLSTLMHRSIVKHPENRASKVRKWLTYLTLFISAGIIIGDLIALLNSMLSGELTLRFGLKALTILAIAGSVFGYYLWDLRQDEEEAK